MTRAEYELADGSRLIWRSRPNRKHGRGLGWWIAALFMIGSACFVIGPIPWYAEAVGARADAVTFFVGSVFFTSASYLQFVQSINAGRHSRLRLLAVQPGRIDWWATAVQLVGTVFFNFTTFDALITGLSPQAEDAIVWTPDALGSICFLVASELALAEVGHRWVSWMPHDLGWRIAAINMLGSILFGISAIGGWVVLSTGQLYNADWDAWGTCLGAVCFFVGAAMLVPEARRQREAG